MKTKPTTNDPRSPFSIPAKTRSFRLYATGGPGFPDCLSLLLMIFVFAGIAGEMRCEAAQPQGPLYKPVVGITNIYDLKIETDGENGTETLAGNVFVHSRASASNTIILCFRARLNPRGEGRSSAISWNSGAPQPNWSTSVVLPEGCELQIDGHGRILRSAGDIPLPVPLGAVAQSFVEPLSIGQQNRWSTTEELAVVDGQKSVGPALSMMPNQPYPTPSFSSFTTTRTPVGVVAVLRQCHYEVKNMKDRRMVIEKRLALSSSLWVGKEPKFSASGDGEFEFDMDAGVLRRLDMKYQAVVTTESVTRRTKAAIQLKLLEGKERETALSQARPTQTAVNPRLTPEDLANIAEDLKSQNGSMRSAAALKLQNHTYFLSEVPPAILESLENHIDDQDSTLRYTAQTIIARFGTVKHIPALLRMIRGGDYSAKSWAFKTLGRLKDARAIDPLIECVARGEGDASAAAEALSKFGSDVEDHALGLFKERHSETRRNACTILRDGGTAKSIPVLSELALDRNPNLSQAAAEAVRSIKARE